MAWPADWTGIYGRQARFAIEIGFGNGLFLLNQAQQQPEVNFLGIEIASPSVKRTANRICDAGITNVRLIRSSAHSVLQILCRPGSIQGVAINFPDPWPKAGHNNRRLISASFLELLASRMAADADLDIATDHAEYAGWINEHLRASLHFDSRLEAPYVRKDRDRVRTKYEQKGLAAGNECFYFKWRRNSQAAPRRFPPVKELSMPHVVARCPLTLQEIAECFEPRPCNFEEVTIRFIDLYESLQRPSLIVDTYIIEQALDQRLMLEISRRPDSDYLITVHATGFPRATAGVHAAIACLTKWLKGLSEEAKVIRHNLKAAPAAEIEGTE